MVAVEETINHMLAYLEEAWADTSNIASEWNSLDTVDQERIQLEWTIREELLDTLRQSVTSGQATVVQVARYERLLRLIGKYEPQIKRLFSQGMDE